jgi:hypothetical protein
LSIVFIPLEIFIRNLDNPYKTKDQYIQKEGGKIELLVFGNSHTYNGINPELFDCNAFSLANVTQTYAYDYYLLTHYSALCPNLKYVILPVSYPSLFRPSLEDINWTTASNYYIYMGKEDHVLSKYNFEVFRPKVFTGKITSWLKGREWNCTSLGWGKQQSMPDEELDLKTALERVESMTYKKRENYEANLNDLTKFLDFCKAHNYLAILVTLPVHPLFYENVDTTQMDLINQTISDLSSKYTLTYLDYMKDPRFTDQDYINVDHLNNIGAEKFTKILNKDIREIIDKK